MKLHYKMNIFDQIRKKKMKNFNKLLKNTNVFQKFKGNFNGKITQKNSFFNLIKRNNSMNLKLAVGVTVVVAGTSAFMKRDFFHQEALEVQAPQIQVVVKESSQQNHQLQQVDITVNKPAGILRRFGAGKMIFHIEIFFNKTNYNKNIKNQGLIDVSVAFSITIVISGLTFALAPQLIIVALPISLVFSFFTLFFADTLTRDETHNFSRSLGKRSMGIVALKFDTGKYCTFGELFIHNLIGGSISQISFLPDILLMLFTEEQRTIADRICGIYFSKQN